MIKSSGKFMKSPAATLMFSVAVYAFPAGFIFSGCEGTVRESLSPAFSEGGV